MCERDRESNIQNRDARGRRQEEQQPTLSGRKGRVAGKLAVVIAFVLSLVTHQGFLGGRRRLLLAQRCVEADQFENSKLGTHTNPTCCMGFQRKKQQNLDACRGKHPRAI